MKLHRFIGSFDLARSRLVIDDAELVNQIQRVLKLAVGEQLVLCDGNANEACAQILSFGAHGVRVKVLDRSDNDAEPRVSVRLYCALLKRENFEWVAQKCTEVGIAELVPLATARTVKLGYRKDRIQKIMHEAAEQSERGRVPVLKESIAYRSAVQSVESKGAFLFDQSG